MSDDKGSTVSGPDLKATRVARTEAELVDAARALFLEHGYVATTLAQVAERAGLAARTVYVRFGTKAALFKRVVDQALVGDAAPVDLAHRPRAQDAMTAETLHERIEALAEVSVGVAERAGALFEVAAQAEGIEPGVAKASQAGRVATTELCRSIWAQAAADGLLPEGVDRGNLVIVTDILVCADTLVHLRRAQTWSASAYQSLIIETLTALTHQPTRLV